MICFAAAGNAFCQAGKLHMQLQSKHDAATSFVDAGNAYKKADPQGKFYAVCGVRHLCHVYTHESSHCIIAGPLLALCS